MRSRTAARACSRDAQDRARPSLRASMAALIKTAARFPVSEVVFFRSIFAMATLVAWLACAANGRRACAPASARPSRPVARRLGRHVRQFLALSLLPLADATAFTFATPLMVVPLASIVLGEVASASTAAAAVAARLRRRARDAVGHLGRGARGGLVGGRRRSSARCVGAWRRIGPAPR